VDDTCLWLESEELVGKWLESGTSSLLWLNGAPGTGKTVLAASMIEKITKDNQGSAAHSPLLYFFCDKKGNEESRLKCISVIRSFFFQLWITTSNSEDPNLTEFWRKLVSSVDLERPYYLPSYTRAARELMNLIPEIFIVLDGLDECEDRASLLSEVIALFKESRTRMRLFITSRPEPDLLKALQN
jgi:Cdc6-like AAA superfamily ATPase